MKFSCDLLNKALKISLNIGRHLHPHLYTLSKVEDEDTEVILGGSGHWRPEVHVGKDAGRLAEVVLIPSVVLTHEMITLASPFNTHLVEAEGLPPLVLGLADGGLVGEPGHGAARPSRPQQQQLQLGLGRGRE